MYKRQEDTLARTILLACNLALMVALVWGSRAAQGGSFALFHLVIVIGVGWWLLALLWLKHYHFASDHDSHARAFKLLAGTLAVVPAWCALGVIHAGEPNGHYWLLLALMLVWAADTGAYFTGRTFGGKWFGGRKPVSYTHLDVYKRQSPASIGPNPGIPGANC